MLPNFVMQLFMIYIILVALRSIHSTVNPCIFEGQHQGNNNKIVFRVGISTNILHLQVLEHGLFTYQVTCCHDFNGISLSL